jgi:uncharacterized protein with FMN-binding domain
MKKYFIGVIIAATFLVYSHLLRSQHSEAVIAPAALSQHTAPVAVAPKATLSQRYKDGTYNGSVENAFYGNVQVSVTIQNGKITAVDFLESPDENPNSLYVNQQAMPYLKQEAIKAQSSNVSVVTGATFTSQAFTQSLSSALRQATQN